MAKWDSMTLPHLLLAIAFSLSLAMPCQALAVLISYDYAFDTPVFEEPTFAPLNMILANAGTTVTGTVSFDSEDIISPSGTVNPYSHKGELDTIGFVELSRSLQVLPSTTILDEIGHWSFAIPDHTVPGPLRSILFRFMIDFTHRAGVATCTTNLQLPESTACIGSGHYVQSMDLVNYNLTRTVPAPEPTTLALLSLGLAGLVFTRRKTKV